MRTIVYADGGADPNPGPGGWGVFVQDADDPAELRGGEADTTNNRMELTAAIRALEHFPEGARIEMRCDSQYVVRSVTEWMRGWKARGWRTASGPVKNRDLMERLDALAAARDVRWVWVRGHAGEIGNERADRLATLGRREALGLDVPPDAARPQEAKSAKPAKPALETVPLSIEAALAERVTAAAARAGQPVPDFVAEALALVVALGPEGVARAKSYLDNARQRRPTAS